MKYIARYDPHLVSDLNDAIEWYAAHSPERVVVSCEEVERAFDVVENHPLRHGLAFDESRCIQLRKFAYLLLYRVSGDVVHIDALLHAATDPATLRQRSSK